MLRVVLNTTLKRYDGNLFIKGTVFSGSLNELPKEIQYAVEYKKPYIEVVEIEDTYIPEVKEESIPDLAEGDIPVSKKPLLKRTKK
jgi:hypothetical protein